MSEHAPGPWKNHHGEIRAANNYVVARIADPVHMHNETTDASANLIAAAPDYHDAAECYVRWMDEYRNALPESVAGAMEAAFGGKLRAAIARATGATP